MAHRIMVPFVQRPEFVISIEQFDEYSLLHCTVHKWSHVTRRKIAADLDTMFEIHGGPFYVIVGDGDQKSRHFIRMFGFVPVGDCSYLDGTSRALYKKDKKQWA